MGNRRRMMNKKEIVYGNGAYIEATNGKLFTSDKWTGSLTANSIVIIDPSYSFRIALMGYSQSYGLPMGSYDTEDIGKYLTAISSSSTAKLDMNATSNTSNILKVKSSSSYVAGWCNSFTFPDGVTKGVLPSLGWLNIAYKYKAAVDTALSKAGAYAMSTAEYFWSSTYYGMLYDDNTGRSRTHFWVLRWTDGNNGLGCVDYDGTLVRAFAEYNPA